MIAIRPLVAGALALGIAAASFGAAAQQAPKPEQLIKWRQSAYQVIAWNSGRIKASVEGTYNKEEVLKAATTISAIANSGLGALFAPGTETGKGWHDTTAKPEIWAAGSKVGEYAGNLAKESTELVKVANTGDLAAVKEQYGKLTRTCKACHDDYKAKE
ncbi:c-type cytochrome [Derxia lacustris]|uniref:c-type cytochrome n=1 Tax=Derxia lacustris TaxID=764842 RepID=UPI000A16E208|nr:cytochrome c [Derxia lacustris]